MELSSGPPILHLYEGSINAPHIFSLPLVAQACVDGQSSCQLPIKDLRLFSIC